MNLTLDVGNRLRNKSLVYDDIFSLFTGQISVFVLPVFRYYDGRHNFSEPLTFNEVNRQEIKYNDTCFFNYFLETPIGQKFLHGNGDYHYGFDNSKATSENSSNNNYYGISHLHNITNNASLPSLPTIFQNLTDFSNCQDSFGNLNVYVFGLSLLSVLFNKESMDTIYITEPMIDDLLDSLYGTYYMPLFHQVHEEGIDIDNDKDLLAFFYDFTFNYLLNKHDCEKECNVQRTEINSRRDSSEERNNNIHPIRSPNDLNESLSIIASNADDKQLTMNVSESFWTPHQLLSNVTADYVSDWGYWLYENANYQEWMALKENYFSL
eukprot:Awhi_evm1s6093